MPAADHDFALEQGATFRRTLEYQNPDTTPFDLSGYTARMHVRARAGAPDPPLVELTTENGGLTIDGPNGTIDVVVSAAQTTALPVGRVVYDLLLVAPSGDIIRLIEGSMVIDAAVTV